MLKSGKLGARKVGVLGIASRRTEGGPHHSGLETLSLGDLAQLRQTICLNLVLAIEKDTRTEALMVSSEVGDSGRD